jgi:hypothetical protein
MNPALVPGEWRKGAVDLDTEPNDPGHRLGVAGPQAGVPVLGVTVPEAMLAAEKLQGQLPTYRQWLKAAGARGDDNRAGPAGPALAAPPERADERRKELARRNLALGLTRGPWPVEKRTADVSYCGVHQLVTNGQEWLGTDESDRRFDLASLPAGESQAVVVGQGPNELYVETFADFHLRLEPWTRRDGVHAGFRIVLEPK